MKEILGGVRAGDHRYDVAVQSHHTFFMGKYVCVLALCVYVCVYVCMNVCMYVSMCVSVCMYFFMYVCTCTLKCNCTIIVQ